MQDAVATIAALATPAPAQTHELTRAELLELTARQAREIVRLSDRNQALSVEVARLGVQNARLQTQLNTANSFVSAVLEDDGEDIPETEAING